MQSKNLLHENFDNVVGLVHGLNWNKMGCLQKLSHHFHNQIMLLHHHGKSYNEVH